MALGGLRGCAGAIGVRCAHGWAERDMEPGHQNVILTIAIVYAL